MTRLLFLLLVPFFTNGQVISSIGLKTGASLANQAWQYKSAGITNKYDYKPGFYIAVSAEAWKTKFTSITADLGFVQKGHRQTLTMYETMGSAGDIVTRDLDMNYLTFSPMLRVHYPIGLVVPYMFAGPRIEYRTGYSADFFPEGEAKLSRSAWGINYGAGLEWRKQYTGILLELQHHKDFSTLANTSPSTDNTGLKVTANAYVITAGVKYYLH